MSEPTVSQPPTAPVAAAAPPKPLAGNIAAHWMLEPGVEFLNHGCFGARLRSVFDFQRAWCERFEGRPVHLLDRRRDDLLADPKAAVGAFLGMSTDDFGFVTNATEGVNTVLRSLRFAPGDEIVTTNHVYNAVRLSMQHRAEAVGAGWRMIDVPLPIAGPDAIVDAVAAGLSARTRLLVIDHVTSPTAVRFPIERIVALCDDRGIDVLVDGAHAPGMLDLDVPAVGAAYYTGNLHKWVCAPPGAAFLYVRPDRQAGIHPTVISHFYGEGLAAEFSWQGTRDMSSWASAAESIRRLGELFGPQSWPRIRAHNHALATWVQGYLTQRLDVPPSTPPDGTMIGSMTAVTLPERARERWPSAEALHDHLYDDCAIEVPVFAWNDRWIVRASCQVYNRREQYEMLAEALLAAINGARA